MEDVQKTDVNQFIKKYINGFVPSSLAFLILYLTFQILTQISSLQKQIAELRASILTKDVVHEISRQECEKFYRVIKSEIEESAYRKILEFHKNDHK